MTEDEAKAYIVERVSEAAFDQLERYVAQLVSESEQQNLVSRSTLELVWSRHILDSAQLAWLAPPGGSWIDIGSGAGLPGIVVAIIREAPMVLIEPRRLRTEFLENCKIALGLDNVTVVQAKAEATKLPKAAVISARAVAKADVLFNGASHLASARTMWLLPKGRSAQSEVAEARRSWQGTFHVEQSIVDDTSGIIVATGVAKR